ncbi:MAG: nonstructural protein [Microvirus sp.]|nr:MAG: nonstructural protein [Microvirus sp.]
MNLQICAVYDSATQMFGRPFFVQARGHALRSFTDEVNKGDKQSDISNHSDDFDLYHFGHFDDNSGIWHLLDKPDLLIRGKDAKLSKEQS